MRDGSSGTAPTFSSLPGVASLAERYDGFILDLWGVVHDGIRPYPGVVACLERLRCAGKKVCLLSNAPRRREAVVEKLREMAVPPDLYDHLYTSGDATYEHLAERPDNWYRALGRRLYHLGPERDASVYRGLDYDLVAAPADADFIVATGIDQDDETLGNHEPVLVQSAARALPMICANPDLVVNSGDRIVLCAGTLAARYEALGGEVRYHGKPHAAVYRRCLELMGIADRRRIAAIGDGLRTDVAGARSAGIDAVLVTGGIHKQECVLPGSEVPDAARVAALSERAGFWPDYVIAMLVW
jgi:HAD superfamily hydrolase (TIGR01459 family)